MNKSGATWLGMFAEQAAEALPEPGEEWQVSEVEELPADSRKLSSMGIIDHVERSEYGQACTYETNERAWERVQEYVEDAGDGET